MNKEEFNSIVTQYEKQIFNHIRRIVGDSEDAEDCLQETFIKTYSHRHFLNPTKNVKNWLYRVATTTSIDFLRKKNRLKEVPYDEDETIGEEITYSNEETQVLRNEVEKALKNLPTGYRTILLLYYYEKFSYLDIASILNLPLNTVKTHLRRAKIALKEYLHQYE
jgi:RNA polymerase sigma-70 factor (ECF subfamily)